MGKFFPKDTIHICGCDLPRSKVSKLGYNELIFLQNKLIVLRIEPLRSNFSNKVNNLGHDQHSCES